MPRKPSGSWRLGLAVAGLGMVVIGLAACSSPEAKAPSASAVAAALSKSQSAAPASGGSAAATAGATKTSEGGSVTIQATWENQKEAGASISFTIAMDTHSVNLDGFDLGRLSSLRNDRGQEVKADRWEAPSGGHHRSGILSFPSKDGSGKPVIGPGVKSLELVMRDVAGVKERVLRWEVS